MIYPHREYFWTTRGVASSQSKNIQDVDKSEGRTETVWIHFMFRVCLLCLFGFCDILSTHKTLVKSRVIAAHVAARKPHASFPRFSRACPAASAWGRGRKQPLCSCGSGRHVDHTNRTTFGRRGEVNLVDTCFQNHLGSL